MKDFFSKCDQRTFTEEILNGKLHFLCSGPDDSSGHYILLAKLKYIDFPFRENLQVF